MNCEVCQTETENKRFCSQSCICTYASNRQVKKKQQGECKACKTTISANRLYCKPCFLLKKQDTTINNQCSICKIEKTIENAYKQKNGKWSAYCKSCFTITMRDRLRKFKLDCVNYKGGKCQKCGYDKCPAALEFHHADPTEKEFVISQAKTKAFNTKSKSELDKCEILCANCHREFHWNN